MKDWKFHCANLGVHENATLKDVRRAYRRLALERHPDKHNGSKESHEAFQQLNESYKFVAAALISGHIPSPSAPVGPGNYSGNLRTQYANNTQKPDAKKPTFPRPPKSFKHVWIHAGVACTALLLISLVIERPDSPVPSHNQSYKPDLFPKAWCFVNGSENGQSLQFVAELWSQTACEEKCNALAKQKDVSCEWSGEKFHLAKVSPPTIPTPSPEVTRASCEISIEKSSGTTNSAYRNQDQQTCEIVCSAMMKEKSRDGVRCTWNGTEFNRQAMAKSPKEVSAQGSQNAQAATNKNITTTQIREIETSTRIGDISDPGVFRATCYMSVVSEEGAFSEPIENQTARSCESRCMSEITRHPTGREVKCAFGGKQIITYIPDPMVSYMARDPAGSGFQQGNEFMASCQIEGRIGKNKILGRADVNTEVECKSACQYEYSKTPKGTEVVCSFNGENFFQRTSAQ